MMICLRAALPNRRLAHSFATRQLIAGPQLVQVLYRNPVRSARFAGKSNGRFRSALRKPQTKLHILLGFLVIPTGLEPVTCPFLEKDHNKYCLFTVVCDKF
jgi:hypothetical protein